MKEVCPKEVEAVVLSGQLPWVKMQRLGLLELMRLQDEAPSAAKLLTALVVAMDKSNALVASHAVLSDMTGKSVSTVRRALKQLEERFLVEVIQLQDRGSANLYKVHERIAWSGRGAGKRAVTTARVLVRGQDQVNPEKLGAERPLVKVDFEALREMGRARGLRGGDQIDMEDWLAQNE